MTNLSKKGVKMSHFAEMCGIDQVSLSKTKKEGTRHLVSANAWNHLNGIYETKSFDEVMQGSCIRFTPSKGARKETIEKQRKINDEFMKQPSKTVESNYEKHIREEKERFEAMQKESKALIEGETLEEKYYKEGLSSMKIKRLAEDPIVKEIVEPTKSGPLYARLSSDGKLYPKENPESPILSTLEQSEITVGMAIDALIKAGAKVSVSLEV
jgi:hypothetical protein